MSGDVQPLSYRRSSDLLEVPGTHVQSLKEMLRMMKQTIQRIATQVRCHFLGKQPASAQSDENLMTIQVPFDFLVNEKLLPAGQYVIKRSPQTPQILLILCPERNIRVAVQSILHSRSKQPRRTSLVFKEYGKERFLSEVNVLGREDRYVLIKSKAECRMGFDCGPKVRLAMVPASLQSSATIYPRVAHCCPACAR